MPADKDRILIALKDPGEVESLSGHLTRTGFDVTTTTDGAVALEAAIGQRPALLIVEPELPVIGGDRLFQILRNNPHTSNTPFLFISDKVTDIDNFRSGVDVFLLRPLNMEEVLGRVVRTIAASQADEDEPRDMEGKLSRISVADILQFLQLNKKQGELRIEAGASRGIVYLKGGHPYNAVVEGAEGHKALYRLLGWTEGRFEFVPKKISIARKIRTSAGSTIMEGIRQLDEFKKNKGSYPSPQSLVKPEVPASKLPRSLSPADREVFSLVGKGASVAEVVANSRRSDYEAYSALATLLARGMITLDKPGRGAAHSGADGEFLTRDQAISIREKLISRFTDSTEANFARIMVVAASGPLAASFIDSCSRIRGFKADMPAAGRPGGRDGPVAPIGEVASFTLYGGMDLVLFAVPMALGMGPVWNAFSTRLAGLVLVWDETGRGELSRLGAAKREVTLSTKAPVAHVYMGPRPGDKDEAFFKKELDLRPDEPVFYTGAGRAGGAGGAGGVGDGTIVSEALYSIFGKLLKGGYAAA